MKMYVLRSNVETELDGHMPLYWNNERAWEIREFATVFSHEESILYKDCEAAMDAVWVEA